MHHTLALSRGASAAPPLSSLSLFAYRSKGLAHAITLAASLALQSFPLRLTSQCLLEVQWFTHRYLIFKPNRAELKAHISKFADSVLG